MTPPLSTSGSAPESETTLRGSLGSSGAEPGAEASEAGRDIGISGLCGNPASRSSGGPSATPQSSNARPARLEHVLDDDLPCPCGHNARSPLPDRFWTNIGPVGPRGCWPWTGSTNGKEGYGKFSYEGRFLYAHRLSYEAFLGPIPTGLTIDHLCRNRACVNPGHLEVVTQRENVLRGMSPGALGARRSHCLRGHRWDEDNLYRSRAGKRHCRSCHREREAARQAALKVNDPARYRAAIARRVERRRQQRAAAKAAA